MKIYLKKKEGVLVPSDRHSQDLIEGLKEGTVYRADIVKPRHLPFHNKYWVMLKIVIENSDYFTGMAPLIAKDLLHDMVKFNTGYWEIIKIKGIPVSRVKSINFDTMDNVKFEEFYKSAVDYISTDKELGVEGLKDWEDF